LASWARYDKETQNKSKHKHGGEVEKLKETKKGKKNKLTFEILEVRQSLLFVQCKLEPVVQLPFSQGLGLLDVFQVVQSVLHFLK
jgi:hypothetical protein